MSTQPTPCIEIFCSYAPEDSALRKRLEQELNGMKQAGKINVWHDEEMLGGAEIEQEIKTHLDIAHIILLLISPDFVDSRYHQETQVKRAMQRHESGGVRVVPILLRSVDIQDYPFFKLRPLPSNKIFVNLWSNRDKAFLNIVQGIRRVVEHLNKPSFQIDPNLREAVQKLENSSGESEEAIKRIKSVLKELNLNQKRVSELKSVHNMLHELEKVLKTMKTLNNRFIENRWEEAQEIIYDLQYFAEQEMKYLEDRLKEENGSISGPGWIIDIIDARNYFQGNLDERNTIKIKDGFTNLLDVCGEHLHRIDGQLFSAVNQVDRLLDQIWRSMNYDSTDRV